MTFYSLYHTKLLIEFVFQRLQMLHIFCRTGDNYLFFWRTLIDSGRENAYLSLGFRVLQLLMKKILP